MANITDLPVEILLHIFEFYMESENQCKLLLMVSNVCQMWKTVCYNRALWIKFDGTVLFKEMMKLGSNGSLNSTKELIVSSIKHFKDEHAAELFSSLKNVEILNLSQVQYFSKNVISILTQSCLKLREIQIGGEKQPEKPLILGASELISFFSSKGSNLTAIKLYYCTVRNANQVLKCLSESCPNLEHFDFTNFCNARVTFPTKYFQLNCPKLKILHLDYNISIGTGHHPLGFPNLEVFSYNDLYIISHINDKDIECILFNSPKLRLLSLTNCSLSVEALCSLPANSVEYLFLSRSRIVNSNYLPDIFKKWCYSLKHVDISYSKNISVNDAILVLTSLPIEPPIEVIDLNYTLITSDTVKRVLETCKKLEILHLTGCRNLNRGLKRSYRNKGELQVLSEKLQEAAYDDSTDEEMPM